MSSYNHIVLIGRVAAQPEQRYTQTGKPVTTFNLAVNRPAAKDQHPEADFIPIVAWQKLAEICSNYLEKGQLIVIDGRLSTRSYTTQDGQKRKVYEVVANTMRMLGRKSENNGNGNGNGSQAESDAQWGPEQFDQAAAAVMEDDAPF
jgi:single-strand DNA-binding protein